MTQHKELIPSLRMAGCNIPIADLAADAIEDLERENEALRKDAERYRFLRRCHWADIPETYVITTRPGVKLGAMTYSDGRLDEVLDAHLARKETRGSQP